MSILAQDKVKLNVKVSDKFEAIRLAGELLVLGGHVPQEYIDKMIEREEVSSTYLGNGVAMPHGTNDAKGMIRSTGISVLVLADEVEFGGEPTRLVIGLAAVGDEHLEVLAGVAGLVSEDEDMKKILEASSEEELFKIFQEGVEA